MRKFILLIALSIAASVISAQVPWSNGKLKVSENGRYLMAYTYTGRDFILQMGHITGKKVNAWWYNPRTGKATVIGKYKNKRKVVFNPPGIKENGNDWVLVLDDTSKNFSVPGSDSL